MKNWVELELTGEARKVWLSKKAKVEEEKVRVKKEKEDKKHKKDKGAKLTKEEYLKQAMMEKLVFGISNIAVKYCSNRVVSFEIERQPKPKKLKNWQPSRKPRRYRPKIKRDIYQNINYKFVPL